MAVVSITVTELKWACLDAEWRRRWLAGERPGTKHLSPPGSYPVAGTEFHSLAEKFAAYLVARGDASASLVSKDQLWSELYTHFAERELDYLANHEKVPSAVYLSNALQAFCARLSELREQTAHFSRWADIILTQEHRLRDTRIPVANRCVFVNGNIDAVRLHPHRGFEIVDYKLSRGTNLKHDLLQLAIYARLLELAQPGMQFHGCLEYYLPELDILEVTEPELLDIFKDLVEPVLAELSEATPQPAPVQPSHEESIIKAGGFAPNSDATAAKIVECFRAFKLPVEISGIHTAPQVIRYLVKPAQGVRVVSLVNRADDLQISLGLEHAPRIEASADGVAIDLPVAEPETIYWHDVVDRGDQGLLSFPVGVGVDNTLIRADLTDPATSHALVAGASGSGKSEWLRSVVASFIHGSLPTAVRLKLIDPKMLTFTGIEKSPHLLDSIVTDVEAATEFLREAVTEMDRRYRILAREPEKNLAERWQAGKADIPFWVIVFDEFAELILAGRESKHQFESAVARLAGKGRAAGIHLILATQRPDRNIVTGIIKANLPLKVCLRVTSATNSQIVLDEPGAEKLLGRGDLLCDSGRGVRRAQGPFIRPDEWSGLGY